MHRLFWLALVLFAAALPARAITLRVSAPALERTLRNQVFTTAPPKPDLPPRRYLHGNGTTGCSTFVDSPEVSFAGERVVVKVHTHANLGFQVKGHCLGIWINTESIVSFVPEAEGEIVGFRDARIDKATDSTELNSLLEPFLARRMPQEMKVNAADLMRTLLVHAPGQSGYRLTLQALQLQSMEVQASELVIQLDAEIRVE